MKPILTAILLMLPLAGCKTAKIAGECPETVESRCMTRKVCSWDQQRGCQVCGCEAALNPVWNEPVSSQPPR